MKGLKQVLVRTTQSLTPVGLAQVPVVGEKIMDRGRRYVVTAVTHIIPQTKWDPIAEIVVAPVDITKQPDGEEATEESSPNRQQRRASKKRN